MELKAAYEGKGMRKEGEEVGKERTLRVRVGMDVRVCENGHVWYGKIFAKGGVGIGTALEW